MRRTIAAFLLSILAPTVAGGLENGCVDYTAYIHWAGELQTHYAFAVTTYGSTAYVAGEDTVYVVDVSDPTHPYRRPSLRLGPSSQARALDNWGPFLFVGDGRRLLIADARGSGPPIVTATLDLPGVAMKIRGGRMAYVACGDAGVAAVDLIDIAQPRIAGRANTPGLALDIALLGSIAYIADYDWGVSVVDFSDPSVPAFTAFLPPVAGRFVESCHVSLGRLYVGSSGGLVVYDLIQDPLHPRLVPSIASPLGSTVRAIATIDFAVIAGQDDGIQTFETVLWDGIGRVRLPAPVRDIEVQGDFAYIANAGAGLQILRVRPAAIVPPLAGVAGTSTGVAASGSRAYLRNGARLEIYDLQVPGSPVLLGSVGTSGGRIDVEGDLAALASTAHVAFVDVLDPHLPVIRSTWSTPGEPRNVDLVGPLAYVACGRQAGGSSGLWDGFVVVDASDPGAPHEIGRYATDWGTQAIRVRDGLAYLATHDSLHIVDVSDPAAPRFVGATRVGSPRNSLDAVQNALDIHGEFAYVPIERAVAIVDVSIPSSPSVVTRVRMPSDPEGIAVRDGVAYIATQFDVELLDVLDPRAPRRAGLATLPSSQVGLVPVDVALADGALLVASDRYDRALSIFPLSCARPTPVVGGELEYTREPGTIHLRARLGEDVDRLRLRRAAGSDAAAATLVHEESGLPPGAWSYDDRAVQDEASYTYVLEITIGGNTVRSAALLVPGSGSRRFGLRLASANPGSGPTRIRFEIDRPAAARLDLYDVAGRHVRNLHRGPMPGSHVIEWDGRDAAGSPAAAGVYLLRLECGGEVATLRVVRSR